MCRFRYFLRDILYFFKARSRGNWFPMRGCFLVQVELWSDRKHFCSYISLNTCSFQGSIFHSFFIWVKASYLECDLDYDQFTAALTIYFKLGLAQVYNISDHCFVAILELLTSDCQRFLNQSRMCQYNWFTTNCQRWLNWNKYVWARCH